MKTRKEGLFHQIIEHVGDHLDDQISNGYDAKTLKKCSDSSVYISDLINDLPDELLVDFGADAPIWDGVTTLDFEGKDWRIIVSFHSDNNGVRFNISHVRNGGKSEIIKECPYDKTLEYLKNHYKEYKNDILPN